jgi:hypothetical protein
MNERIKELGRQAGYPDRLAYGTDLVMEKFAELIVRECAKIAVEHEEYCEIKMMPTYAIDMHILERFGVEE